MLLKVDHYPTLQFSVLDLMEDLKIGPLSNLPSFVIDREYLRPSGFPSSPRVYVF